MDIEERRDCQREVPGYYDNWSGEHNYGHCCGIDSRKPIEGGAK
jgi:hypothetical protein